MSPAKGTLCTVIRKWPLALCQQMWRRRNRNDKEKRTTTLTESFPSRSLKLRSLFIFPQVQRKWFWRYFVLGTTMPSEKLRLQTVGKSMYVQTFFFIFLERESRCHNTRMHSEMLRDNMFETIYFPRLSDMIGGKNRWGLLEDILSERGIGKDPIKFCETTIDWELEIGKDPSVKQVLSERSR